MNIRLLDLIVSLATLAAQLVCAATADGQVYPFHHGASERDQRNCSAVVIGWDSQGRIVVVSAYHCVAPHIHGKASNEDEPRQVARFGTMVQVGGKDIPVAQVGYLQSMRADVALFVGEDPGGDFTIAPLAGEPLKVGETAYLDGYMGGRRSKRRGTGLPATHSMMRIQTTVNGGDSGGAFLNESGELVGIVSAKNVNHPTIPGNVALGTRVHPDIRQLVGQTLGEVYSDRSRTQPQMGGASPLAPPEELEPFESPSQPPPQQAPPSPQGTGKPTLYAFGSTWCAPCQWWKNDYNDDLEFRAELDRYFDVELVNRERNLDLATKWRVGPVPAFRSTNGAVVNGYEGKAWLLSKLRAYMIDEPQPRPEDLPPRPPLDPGGGIAKPDCPHGGGVPNGKCPPDCVSKREHAQAMAQVEEKISSIGLNLEETTNVTVQIANRLTTVEANLTDIKAALAATQTQVDVNSSKLSAVEARLKALESFAEDVEKIGGQYDERLSDLEKGISQDVWIIDGDGNVVDRDTYRLGQEPIKLQFKPVRKPAPE